jgi:uncharacterized protein (TIGR04551 family)
MLTRWTLCVGITLALAFGWTTQDAAADGDDDSRLLAQAGDGGGADERANAKKDREAAMKALINQYPAKGDDGATSSPTPSGNPASVALPPSGADSLVRMEHHGYFRLRTDLFYNMDLNTKGTSPIAPPLLSNERRADAQSQTNHNGDESLSSLNMRFRYSPTFNIKEHLRVHATFDILDNIVLGSTPDGLRGARPDVGNPALTRSSEQPLTSTVGKDAIEVREVYGEIVWTFGTFRAGRMANDWGLGMLLNSGSQFSASRAAANPDGQNWRCLDCDFGDYIDRLQFEVRDPFSDLFYVSLAWDFPSTGLASYNSGSGASPISSQSFGQPLDLDPGDDTTQFTLSIFDKPISQQEILLRRHALTKSAPLFDWGALLIIRYQDKGLDRQPTAADFTGASTGGSDQSPQLRNQSLSVLSPDLWARMILPLGTKRYLRVEGELAANFGSLAARTDNTLAASDFSRDIQQFGGALEVELRWTDLFAFFNAGFATGNSAYGFGYLDTNPYNTPDPRTNEFSKNINGFQFHRNYMIDTIMFRELVGGITNAVYFNPAFAYRLADIANAREESSLGVRLDIITAAALSAKATPGNQSWYGLESDLKLFYEERNDYRLELISGLFIPGGAWDRRAGDAIEHPALTSIYELSTDDIDRGLTSNLAWSLQANFWWLF